jgi:type VI secretion system protein VasD
VSISVKSVAAMSVALALCGCAGALKPAQVVGTLQASATINPSVSKRPSPLLVRVYELKSATAFNSIDFVSLYQRDQAELGADLLGRDEYMLAPGETRAFTKTLAPDTRFIGVLGAFRDLEHARWRSVLPVQPGRKQEIVIRADELSVAATAKP